MGSQRGSDTDWTSERDLKNNCYQAGEAAIIKISCKLPFLFPGPRLAWSMFSSCFAEFEPPWALNHQINWDDDADLMTPFPQPVASTKTRTLLTFATSLCWIPFSLHEYACIPSLKPGEGNGNPVQYACLENPHGRKEPGRLQSKGSQKSRTRLKRPNLL